MAVMFGIFLFLFFVFMFVVVRIADALEGIEESFDIWRKKH